MEQKILVLSYETDLSNNINAQLFKSTLFDIYGVQPSNPIHNNYFEKN